MLSENDEWISFSSSRTWPRRLARSTGYDPAEIAYGVSKVAAQCLRALSSTDQQEVIHRDLMHKYAKGSAAQLTNYEQALSDLIPPVADEDGDHHGSIHQSFNKWNRTRRGDIFLSKFFPPPVQCQWIEYTENKGDSRGIRTGVINKGSVVYSKIQKDYLQACVQDGFIVIIVVVIVFVVITRCETIHGVVDAFGIVEPISQDRFNGDTLLVKIV